MSVSWLSCLGVTICSRRCLLYDSEWNKCDCYWLFIYSFLYLLACTCNHYGSFSANPARFLCHISLRGRNSWQRNCLIWSRSRLDQKLCRRDVTNRNVADNFGLRQTFLCDICVPMSSPCLRTRSDPLNEQNSVREMSQIICNKVCPCNPSLSWYQYCGSTLMSSWSTKSALQCYVINAIVSENFVSNLSLGKRNKFLFFVLFSLLDFAYPAKSPCRYQYCRVCRICWNRDVNGGINIVQNGIRLFRGEPLKQDFDREVQAPPRTWTSFTAIVVDSVLIYQINVKLNLLHLHLLQ